MKVLILGGTWFLGRALAQDALSRGWEVTTFNRGTTAPDVPGVHAVHGDRTDTAAVTALADHGPWNAIIDPGNLAPRTVLANARALRSAGRYVLISTVSAYQGWPNEPLTEESPLLEAPADAGDDFGYRGPDGFPTPYGFRKAGCERAVTDVFGSEAVIVRPGVIIGPHEYVGRLPWWLRRMAQGGTVIGPGDPERGIQPVDVRDVAAFVNHLVEYGGIGAYNVTAPRGHATFASFLHTCARTVGAEPDLVWVNDELLRKCGIKPWTEIPLWRPHAGAWDVASDRARAAGLECRPLEETVRDTWEWLSMGGSPIPHPRAEQLGITTDAERRLLAARSARP
jgi:nucleoside-diphosphate-sugar epimerase